MPRDLLTEARLEGEALQRVLRSAGNPDVLLDNKDYQLLGSVADAIFQRKAVALQPLSGRGGWWTVIREPYMGSWQRNQEVRMDTVLTYSAVFSCVTLIAADIAKLNLRLVQQDADGVWTETESPAFSPVLRKPNRYQTRIKFIEQWIVSKLIHGNTYVLKQRDLRGIVTALYVLDPTRVTPLVAPNGDVYYELKRDDLSGLPQEKITIPAREIIHDTMVSLYHPLIGVSPIYASGLAAMQGLSIQDNSNKFFANGSQPSGLLSVPTAIDDAQADRMKAAWQESFTGDNVGNVALLTNGVTYQTLAVNAVDAQLIEQLKWTAETVCSCFHVPAYMIGVGNPPPYANFEPLVQSYHAQCIQSLTTNLEVCLDEGCELPKPYGTEFDIDELYWMDLAARTKTASEGMRSGLSVNEVRKRCHGAPRVPGGDVVYMQEQNHSLEALAAIDKAKIRAAEQPAQAPELPASDEEDDDMEMAASLPGLLRKELRARRAA